MSGGDPCGRARVLLSVASRGVSVAAAVAAGHSALEYVFAVACLRESRPVVTLVPCSAGPFPNSPQDMASASSRCPLRGLPGRCFPRSSICWGALTAPGIRSRVRVPVGLELVLLGLLGPLLRRPLLRRLLLRRLLLRRGRPLRRPPP